MEVNRCCILFLVASSALLNFSLLTTMAASSSSNDNNGGSSRKLLKTMILQGNVHVNLEDYHPIDPVPSSKASIRPGPIEHGSPLNPFIPKPPPPAHPKRIGFP